MLEQLLPKIFNSINETNNHQRRTSLVKEMERLEINQLSCSACIGNCCTFTSNSMRVSPLEAIDILAFSKKTIG